MSAVRLGPLVMVILEGMLPLYFSITSCSPSAPGNVTPPYPPAVLPAGDTVAFTAGDRGASGDIEENTSEWCNCSYVVQLNTTPKLTTGLQDRSTITNQLTFAICDHSC